MQMIIKSNFTKKISITNTIVLMEGSDKQKLDNEKQLWQDDDIKKQDDDIKKQKDNKVQNLSFGKTQPENIPDYYYFIHFKHLLNQLTQIVPPNDYPPHYDSTFKLKLYLSKLIKESYFQTRSLQSNNPFNSDHVKIKIHKKTKHHHVLLIYVQYNQYTKRYTVINHLKQSHRHRNELLGIGTFGNVYHCESLTQNPQIVVKCLKYDEKDLQSLKSNIKEFFIYDLMSALEIGPKIIKNHSFDFVLFKNCIQFHMERCYPLKPQTLEKDIKLSLFKMHLLHFVHSDIKPSNIMYSQTLKKNVLVDFGLATMINEKVTQKTISNFKGTYEFCGNKMKELLGKKTVMEIDLYLNDVEMIENSVKYVQNALKSVENKQQMNEVKKKQKSSKSSVVSKQQMSLMFKYHLYADKTKFNLSQQTVYFIDRLENYPNGKQKSEIIEQGVKFVEFLDSPNDITLIYDRILHKLISKHLKKQFFEDQKEIQFEDQHHKNKQKNIHQQLAQKFKQIYVFLEKDFQLEKNKTSQSGNQKKEENYNFNNLTIQDIQSIFFWSTELQLYTNEQIYAIFLKYVSFWQSKFKVDISQKQKAASVVRKIIESRSKGPQARFLSDSYTPELQFVKDKCQYLVFVYGYLLSYCMEGQFNKFKQLYMMLILKDSIILNFQYMRWITDYAIVYFKGLISIRYRKLMTRMIIDYNEVKFLSRKNFYLSSSLELDDMGMGRLNYERLLKECMQQIQKSCKQQDVYYIKKLFLEHIYNSESNRWGEKQLRQPLEEVNNLINHQMMVIDQNDMSQAIDKFKEKAGLGFFDEKFVAGCVRQQFSQDEFIETDSDYLLSQYYIRHLFKSFNAFINKRNQQHALFQRYSNAPNIMLILGFDIKLFSQHNQLIYNPQAFFQQLKAFDQKINCQQLSHSFHLVQRYLLSGYSGNVNQVLRILNLITTNKGCPSQNSDILLKIQPNYLIQSNIRQMAEKSPQIGVQYLNQLKKLCFLCNKIVALSLPDKQKLNNALQRNLRKSLMHSSMDPRFYSFQQNIRFFEELNKQLFYTSSKSYTLNIIMNLSDPYSLKFLETRKQLFTFLANSFSCLLQFQSPTTQAREFLDQTYELFCLQILKNVHLPEKSIKCWQGLKLLTLLKRNKFQTANDQFPSTLVAAHRVKQLAQVFFVIFLQSNNQPGILKAFINQEPDFRKFSRFSTIRSQFYSEFYFCLKQLKKVTEGPLKLLPIYFCILQFDDELIKQPKRYKKLMLQMYLKFNKFIEGSQINPYLKLEFRNMVYLMSVRYLKVINSGQGKIKNLIRSHCKNCNKNQSQNSKVYQFYLRRLRTEAFDGFEINNEYGEEKQSQIKRKQQQMKKTLQKLEKNCGIKKMLSSKGLQRQQQEVYFRHLSMQPLQLEKSLLKELQFKQKYNVKDMRLFKIKNVVVEYEQLTSGQSEDMGFSYEMMDMFEEKVHSIKKSQENIIAEESLLLFDQILQIKRKILERELRSTFFDKSVDLKNIPIHLVFRQFC